MNSSIHGVLKVALVGEAEVGKTQILQKYVHNTFAEKYTLKDIATAQLSGLNFLPKSS